MAEVFPIWPRRRATALALTGLIVLQFVLFLAATQASFFTHEDFYHFALARERHVLHYLVTPIIHTYPAPGHRLLFLLLQESFPLNYVAARVVLLAILGGTTILLGQLVRMLARSDAWWTVALLAPFALSLTLVGPVNLWSNGVPVLPALFFTVLAFCAWFRSYAGTNPTFWTAITVIAMTAAGAFYTKFLLIPMYLLFFRLVIFPRIFGLPVGIDHLWRERRRWIAVAAPPVLFLAVYVLSGLAARSHVPGERPFFEYLVTAWFRAFIPVSLLNVPIDGSTSPALAWAIVAASQVVFWTVVLATWRRSSLALRGWALVLIAFATNMIMVGAARLPGFGVEIAYWLRYYPEVVLFVPIALALGLRDGEERRPDLAWERTTAGQVTMGVVACAHVIGLAVWAPRLVSTSDGVLAKAWFENLRRDLDAVSAASEPLRLIDSDTPDYVVLSWMVPYNRISTIMGLLQVDAVYNRLSDRTYVVLDDGRLAPATFRAIRTLQPESVSDSVHLVAGRSTSGSTSCADDRRPLRYPAEAELSHERLAVRVFYSGRGNAAAALEVDTGNAYERYRTLRLRPFENTAELVDLGTAHMRALQVQVSSGDIVCVERLEIGALGHGQ